jgi:hypothetical protein
MLPSAYRRHALRATEGKPSCVAKQVTRPVRNRKASVIERQQRKLHEYLDPRHFPRAQRPGSVIRYRNPVSRATEMLDIATWMTMALMQFPLRHVKTSDASAIVGLVATGVKRMWDHPMS